jgi:hypothetical protein
VWKTRRTLPRARRDNSSASVHLLEPRGAKSSTSNPVRNRRTGFDVVTSFRA